MAAIEIAFPADGPAGKILKWRVRTDTMVAAGRVLLIYRNATPDDNDTAEPEKKLRATRFGRVRKLLVNEGDVVQPGQGILSLEGCTHPTVMIDLCAECGADLRVEQADKDGKIAGVSQASVPMVHSIPELKVCPELAEKIGKKDEQRLLKDRKLVLLVDLDQTIVHTTNDHIPPNLKDVHHFQLYGPNSPWYHTRLRPNTRHFLSEMSHLYELHICSFGARIYAHTIASLLDKDGILFSHRILSRDECFDPASKTANLKALFPCGDDLVCIIDDREDVWQGCGNLVQVKPYHFFRHTGDINAPPGLDKGDTWRTPESENTSETCVTNSKNKDSKNNVPKSSSEPSDDASMKEASPETDENCDKPKEADNGNTKVNPEEEADSKAQSANEAQPAVVSEAQSAAVSEAQSAAVSETQSAAVSETQPAAVSETQPVVSETQPAAVSETQPAAVSETQPAAVSETQPAAVSEAQPAAVSEAQSAAVSETQPAAVSEAQTTAEDTTVVNETEPAAVSEAQPTAEDEAQSATASKDDTTDKKVTKATPPEEAEKNNKQETSKSESNVIDEDDDDYLLYLEDILRRIHTEFYCTLDKGNGRKSLRDIIPRVRSQVLKGLCLTFSGLIPTHQKLHQSRAYKVARAFGAEVTQDLTEKTTHLVAIRKGTAKANSAKKETNIRIVNPEWLWTCAERWEHVDERLFPVTSQARGSRVPPPHCSSPESVEEVESNNSAANSFANTINPLMSFTQEEIEFMDKEVEEDMLEQDTVFDVEDEENEEAEQDESMEVEEEYGTRIRRRSFDSDDSMNSEWALEKKRRKIENGNSDESSSEDKEENRNSHDDDDDDDDDDDPVTRFRRGEDLPDDLDLGDNSQDSIDDFEGGDNEDDREWNALGAALEREFLAE